MKKRLFCSMLGAAIALGAAVVVAATKVTVIAEPGARAFDSANVAKPTHIEVLAGLPATGTATLYRVVGTATSTVASAALTGGAYAGPITAYTNSLLRGDTLLLGGSVTSGVVRLISDGD